MQNCNEPWAENDDKCQKKLLTNVNGKNGEKESGSI
jgi:hypothetical protein